MLNISISITLQGRPAVKRFDLLLHQQQPITIQKTGTLLMCTLLALLARSPVRLTRRQVQRTRPAKSPARICVA
ncbi:hypothetical protein C4C37_17955 [Pseudomonas amygdali pv. lachrymans]|uniref:hypothetical protein n=1 Tax=Pseudomonas amygdali TaxID=47877 RepID=UPI001BDE5950|nr:hypothetical protein [Pseudomonas amygdali]QWA48503.1 hypothetical protein C4C37_17955 [Pseudomonas amygdali pv. lachrymans]